MLDETGSRQRDELKQLAARNLQEALMDIEGTIACAAVACMYVQDETLITRLRNYERSLEIVYENLKDLRNEIFKERWITEEERRLCECTRLKFLHARKA